MHDRKKLYFAVTNDLSYDQRMIRICTTLARQYEVTLVGRKLAASPTLQQQPFRQHRLHCFFNKGIWFYAEYNARLFLFLLFRRMDLVCAIDLDTIIPCYLVSKLKNIKRVYDAHELFCEMKEIVTRPFIYNCWKRIERYFVPRFTLGYTVNSMIAAEFAKMYGSSFAVVRNLPVLRPLSIPMKEQKYILYQGAVNEGRSFETLIPAMKSVGAPLVICGDGNFMQQARRLVADLSLENKVIFKGRILPGELRELTVGACAGITLFDNNGLSNYLSLSNRFFDYLHAGIPQLCVNYPVYRELNKELPFSLLIDNLDSTTIANKLNTLLEDQTLYDELQQNCLKVRLKLNWQEEEKTLIRFYNQLW